MKRTSHSYYVTMIDYGPNYIGKVGPSGLEAVVDPEITRRGVVDRIATGEYKNVSFIHHITDGICDDVTGDIMGDAALAAIELALEAA